MNMEKLKAFTIYTMAIAMGYFLAVSFARADEVMIKAGVGLEPFPMVDVSQKYASLGYNYTLGEVIYVPLTIGSFFEAPHFTYYCSTGIGVRVSPTRGLRVDTSFGPGVISRPSASLGGRVQFFFSIGPSFQDPKTKATIGFRVEHMSNAGIVQPNIGKNYFVLNIGLPI